MEILPSEGRGKRRHGELLLNGIPSLRGSMRGNLGKPVRTSHLTPVFFKGSSQRNFADRVGGSVSHLKFAYFIDIWMVTPEMPK